MRHLHWRGCVLTLQYFVVYTYTATRWNARCSSGTRVKMSSAFNLLRRTLIPVPARVSSSTTRCVLWPAALPYLAVLTHVVADTCAQCQVDFVDLNMGCPLGGVCKRGMGSALMNRANRVKVLHSLVALYPRHRASCSQRVGVPGRASFAKPTRCWGARSR